MGRFFSRFFGASEASEANDTDDATSTPFGDVDYGPTKTPGADDPLVQPPNDPAMPTTPWRPMTPADYARDPRDPACDSAGPPVEVPVFTPPKGPQGGR